MKRFTKRKLTKSSLDELAERMPVLSEEMQAYFWGGTTYNNDCFWRCVAYLSGGGYSESDAENYANNFNPESGYYYTNDSGVSDEDMNRFQRENFNSFSGTILKIDPDKVPNKTGAGYHTVVYLETNPDGSYSVYDPQERKYYDVPISALEKTYVFAGPESGDVSGSYGDTSGGDDVSGSYDDTSGGSGNITGIWNP